MSLKEVKDFQEKPSSGTPIRASAWLRYYSSIKTQLNHNRYAAFYLYDDVHDDDFIALIHRHKTW